MIFTHLIAHKGGKLVWKRLLRKVHARCSPGPNLGLSVAGMFLLGPKVPSPTTSAASAGRLPRHHASLTKKG